jgi:hypothetical protein
MFEIECHALMVKQQGLKQQKKNHDADHEMVELCWCIGTDVLGSLMV